MKNCLHLPKNLSWQELLSSEEIQGWAENHRRPHKNGLLRAGVYRFIFPDKRCYLGEAGHLGNRLTRHINPHQTIVAELCPNEDNCASNCKYKVCCAVRRSIGQCLLQVLTIDGTIKLCGLTLSQNDLTNESVRLLLESSAIHSSIDEDLRPLNYGYAWLRANPKARLIVL